LPAPCRYATRTPCTDVIGAVLPTYPACILRPAIPRRFSFALRSNCAFLKAAHKGNTNSRAACCPHRPAPLTGSQTLALLKQLMRFCTKKRAMWPAMRKCSANTPRLKHGWTEQSVFLVFARWRKRKDRKHLPGLILHLGLHLNKQILALINIAVHDSLHDRGLHTHELRPSLGAKLATIH